MRHVLTESILLAVAGGTAGLLIAVWCNRFLNVIELPIPVEVAFGLNLDGRVVAFAFIASLITGVVFGILPAWRAAKADAFPALKDERRVA
jgi:ABC-type lipoprotein release transport system permease subunit